jgi:hypothetical protein
VVLDFVFGKTEVRRKWIETISPVNLSPLPGNKKIPPEEGGTLIMLLKTVIF